MSDPILVHAFQGQNGYQVERDAGVKGELDSADTVARDGKNVVWNDPAFVAARDAFAQRRDDVSRITSAVQSYSCTLQPPTTAVTRRSCEAVDNAGRPTNAALQKLIASARAIADDQTNAPVTRSQAYALVAWVEGLVAKHFTAMPWNRIEPGRRALRALENAMRNDGENVAAHCAYTMSMFGMRSSGFREQAESSMRVNTTVALARMAPTLATARDDLLAQTLLLYTLADLKSEDRLTPELERLGEGLQQRIATLRARSADDAEDVDTKIRSVR